MIAALGIIMKKNIKCFEPIVDEACEILILGSMPSSISRENNFYYSNPTNRFWKILSCIFNCDVTKSDPSQKKSFLLKQHIALFDVYKQCQMKKTGSSLDSNIIKQQFNNIPDLIKSTKIKRIFITSKKAYNDFIKHFDYFIKSSEIKVCYLPSPSSANRSVFKTDEELIDCWKKLIIN